MYINSKYIVSDILLPAGLYSILVNTLILLLLLLVIGLSCQILKSTVRLSIYLCLSLFI